MDKQEGVLSTICPGGAHASGNMFNLEITSQLGITITSLDLHIYEVGTTNIRIYISEEGYEGKHDNPLAWEFNQEVKNVQGLGKFNPFTIDINPIFLKGGKTYGIYITTDSNSINLSYTSGANEYSDSHVKLTTGLGLKYPFGEMYEPRTWNGSIHYVVGVVPFPFWAVGIVFILFALGILFRFGNKIL